MERMKDPLPKTLLTRLGDIVFGAKGGPSVHEVERSSGDTGKGRKPRQKSSSERLMDLIFGTKDEGDRK